MHVKDEDLQSYFWETLPLIEEVAITSHLGACATCQGKLADSAEFKRRLAALARGGDKSPKERRRHARIATDMPTSVRIISPSSSGRTQARVLDTSRDGVRLRVFEFMQPGAMVHVRLVDTIVLGEVRYCRPVGSAFQAGVHIRDSFPASTVGSVHSKRKEPRNIVNAASYLRIEGTPVLHPITIQDVSRTGLRIRSRLAIRPGARVRVTYKNVVISGEVRYAHELTPDAFNVGIHADGLTGEHRILDGDMDLTLMFNLQAC